MLRLVLSKTGQETEGDWRPGQECYFTLAQGRLELQRPEGHRWAVLSPDAAEPHACRSCGSPYTRGPVGEVVPFLIHGQKEKGDGER